MKPNKRKARLLFAFFFSLAILVVGCGQEEKRPEEAQALTEEQQLYSCGMHPNVIQEGPGNCPICGMKLTPIGGVSTASASVSSTSSEERGEKKILYWRAPMDPTYISPKPGKSPMGMDLVPVYEGEEAFGSTVKINPVVEQNMGIRVATAEKRDLYRKIRTIGRIDYDESKVAHVHTKFSGWIEKTHVNVTGQKVSRGELLLDIYSPQLVSAQEEYLDALQNLRALGGKVSEGAGGNLRSILASSRRRMEYFDVSEDQIEQIANTGTVTKTMGILSPFRGIVVEKHALDGMEVETGMMLYLIADLSEIWVFADIYEYEVPWVKEGQVATMTLSYDPGKKYRGKVQYIYPYLEEKTRTIKVRLVFPNPSLDLKPGMYANVEIESSPVESVVAVPVEAVLFSGERNLVFVSLGEGRFAPRDVTTGIESGDGYYEVKKGLSEGEVVVTSGQFLLDSESKLQESIAKLLEIRTGLEEAHDHQMLEDEENESQ
ncbi:MAG: efflux RND transporter periplasmic adaptor subunit [Candidatus Neomarinimicrobiota bacterium]